MKLVVIGGGSTYTPELIDGILQRRNRLPISEIVLVDPNSERVAIVAEFAKRMIAFKAATINLSWTVDAKTAIPGADFVVSQFRVGSQSARHRDELLGREFGLIGQETVGVGGFAKALRTIPEVLKLADLMRTYSPNAYLINFTNPAGLITETLQRHASDLTSIGLCNVPWNVRKEVADLLKIPSEKIALDYVGLNHLSWVRGVAVDGISRTTEAFAGFHSLTINQSSTQAEPEWKESIIEKMNSIPNYYLMYYYQTQEWIAYQKTHPTRASRVAEIEDELLRKYADVDLCEKPAELMQRGGAYYSDSAAELMADIAQDAGSIHIVNTRNNGAIPDLPDEVVMEIPAIIDQAGAHSIKSTGLREDMGSLISAVKNFELSTIEAAMTGSEELARQALLQNPLGPTEETVDRLWSRLKEVNQGLLGALNA
jgi:6-phospho-beta-glucosidase